MLALLLALTATILLALRLRWQENVDREELSYQVFQSRLSHLKPKSTANKPKSGENGAPVTKQH
jgi:hypothetical protein